MSALKKRYKSFLKQDVEFVRDTVPEDVLKGLGIDATEARVPNPACPRLASEVLMRAFKTKKYPNHQYGYLAQETTQISDYLGLIPAEINPLEFQCTSDFSSEDSAACQDAEPCFIDAKNVGSYATRTTDQSVNVFHAPSGSPLLFGKEVYARTCLTLQPMTGDDLFVPTGTIVATARDMAQHSTSMQITGKSSVVETFEINGMPRIAPLRLSPWAFEDVENRSLYALTPTNWGNDMQVDTHRFSQIREATMEDFTHIAHALVRELVSVG